MTEINNVLEAMTRLCRILMEQFSTAKTLEDDAIVACKDLLPKWEINLSVKKDECYTYNDKVYRVVQEHTTQDSWTPDKTPAMWVVIDITHAGTKEDPIPASKGMEYEYGKYYLDPEDEKVYLCKREGEQDGNKVTLQYLPHEVIGQYFVLAE